MFALFWTSSKILDFQRLTSGCISHKIEEERRRANIKNKKV